MASGSSDGEQQRNRNHNKLKYLMDTLSDSHSSVQAGEAQSASDPEHKVVPASRRFRDPVVGDVVYVTSGPHIGKQVRVTSLVTSNKELLNVRFLHAGSSEGQNGLRIFKDHLTLDKDAPGLKGKKAARCNLITGTWGKSPYDHRTVKATHPPSPQKQQHRPSNPEVSPHLPTARPAQVSPSLVFPKGEIVDILSGAHRGKIATVLGTVRAGPGLQNRLALRDEVHMDVFLYPSQLRRASGGQPPQKVSHPPALAQTATAKPVPEPPLSRRGTLPAKGNNMPARVQPGPTSATMPATPQALQTASPPKESRPLAARAHAGLSPAPRVPPLQRLVCGTTASASTAVGTNRTVPLRPPVQQVHRTAPPRATVPVPVAQVRVPEPNLLKISDVRLGDTVRIMRGPWWGKTARVQRWGGKPGTIVVALLSDLTSTRRICESEVVVTSRRVE